MLVFKLNRKVLYSRRDDLLARRLHADLQDHGVRCWFATQDLVPGDFFRQKIDQAIQQQDRFLLIFTEHSVNSKWVKPTLAVSILAERT